MNINSVLGKDWISKNYSEETVNYLKDNKEAIYTFNWEHREIIVYEEKSNA